MKKIIVILLLLTGCGVMSPLQNSKLIAVFHLIEIANFKEAKDVVEEMIEDEESRKWAKTWYARGLIAQTAYLEGKKKNDKKLFELYPDQLNVAYDSYERARNLDKRERFERQLAPRYVVLANEFKKSAEAHFKNQKYEDALRAYEKALAISESPFISVEMDTNLIYNTALAAHEDGKEDRAIELLKRLDEYAFSTNVTHLLSFIYLEQEDTLAARQVLSDGIERYDENEGLYLLLVDLLYKNNKIEDAIDVLDQAITDYPEKHVYPYTKGLIYQKTENYTSAIESYNSAIELDAEHVLTYINIATCFYNIGVEIEGNAMRINNNTMVIQERARSAQAFEDAVTWLNKAYDLKPEDHVLTEKIYQLYQSLKINERVRNMQGLSN